MQEKGFSGHNRGMCRKCGKLHRSNSGEKHHMKNHIYQERVRRKLLGRKKSEEHRLHLSMSHLGKVPVNKSHKFNGEVCPKCGRTHQNTIRGHKFNGMPCPVCGKTHKDTTGINNTGSTLIARKKKSDAAKGKPKPWFIGDNNPMRRMPELREASRQRWKDPIFKKNAIEKMLLTVRRRPNKTEKVFELSLNEMFPNEWKYCGDGSVLIGWKNPDYININGQKKLIELFGDYWHIEEDISVRTNHFKKYGYDTLVIWEHELKDIQAVKEKILEFNKR